MNTSQIEFTMTGKAPSQTDALINALHEADGAWVPLPTLVDIVGGYAIHSRANDARSRGVNIENKVEFSQVTGKRHSWYRLLAP